MYSQRNATVFVALTNCIKRKTYANTFFITNLKSYVSVKFPAVALKWLNQQCLKMLNCGHKKQLHGNVKCESVRVALEKIIKSSSVSS